MDWMECYSIGMVYVCSVHTYCGYRFEHDSNSTFSNFCIKVKEIFFSSGIDSNDIKQTMTLP